MTSLPERHKSLPRAAMLMLAVAFVLLFAGGRSSAATYAVDVANDPIVGPSACTGAPGDCSLRGAIDKANADAAADTLTFPSVSTVTIDSPLQLITEKLSVNGAGTTEIVGSGGYSCAGSNYAFDTTATQVSLLQLPIYSVCGRPIKSTVAAPTIQIGPRRADNTVSINGTGAGANVDVFRVDTPAISGEARTYFDSAPAPGGAWSVPLVPLPLPTDKFTAAGTDSLGRTSTFAAPISAPADLASPVLNNAVANANNSIRLDFNEAIGGNITGAVSAFALNMGAVNRQITSVDVSGNSVYLGSATTPWATGEAGTVAFTGTTRVTDPTGNEVLGTPSKNVFAGPGEINFPVVSKFRTDPAKFCQRKTSKCRRGQTYLYITLNKPARVVFNIYRAAGRRFVVRYVRKLPVGTSKTRLFNIISGRRLPATSLIVNAVAEDSARNQSAPVDAPFKVVTRKAQL